MVEGRCSFAWQAGLAQSGIAVPTASPGPPRALGSVHSFAQQNIQCFVMLLLVPSRTMACSESGPVRGTRGHASPVLIGPDPTAQLSNGALG